MDRTPSTIKAPASSVTMTIWGVRVCRTRINGYASDSSVTPSTNPMLVIFDPSALPTASSPDPDSDAMMDTTISGADVPVRQWSSQSAAVTCRRDSQWQPRPLRTYPSSKRGLQGPGNEYKIQHVIRVLTFRFKNAPLSISDRVSYGNVSAEQTPTPVKSEDSSQQFTF